MIKTFATKEAHWVRRKGKNPIFGLCYASSTVQDKASYFIIIIITTEQLQNLSHLSSSLFLMNQHYIQQLDTLGMLMIVVEAALVKVTCRSTLVLVLCHWNYRRSHAFLIPLSLKLIPWEYPSDSSFFIQFHASSHKNIQQPTKLHHVHTHTSSSSFPSPYSLPHTFIAS